MTAEKIVDRIKRKFYDKIKRITDEGRKKPGAPRKSQFQSAVRRPQPLPSKPQLPSRNSTFQRAVRQSKELSTENYDPLPLSATEEKGFAKSLNRNIADYLGR